MTQEEEWLLKEKYNGQKTEGFLTDCDRLKAGEPLAYLIGSIPFLHTTIHLDSRPLIPRTETEFWVKKIIDHITQSSQGPALTGWKILDLCAGSGCIGIAVLKNIPSATADFAEIDGRHHSTIQKNIIENDIDTARTRIFGGDLFVQCSDKYDYILTNPPYIDPAHNLTSDSVQKYEPPQALYAAQAGLDIIFRIIDKAPDFLTLNGTLVIEHDPEQSEKISEYASTHRFITQTEEDQYGHKRFTTFRNQE